MRDERIMETKKMSNVLKYTFLTSGSVALVFGLIFMLMPEVYLSLLGWTSIYDPLFPRVLGAALLGCWLLQWLYSRETEWKNVKKIVIVMIYWHAMGCVASLMSQFYFNLPATNWMHTIVFLIFLIAYIYCYYKGR
jgi:hypothetical protein